MALTWEHSILIVSAMTNGCLCICITLAIEKLGGALGGILGCIPSTLLVVVWGHWSRHSATSSSSWVLTFPYISAADFFNYQKTIMSIPPGMLVNSLYLLLWKVIPPFYLHRYPRFSLYPLLLSVFLTTITVWFACILAIKYTLIELLPSPPSPTVLHESLSPFTSLLTWMYVVGIGATVVTLLGGIVVCWWPADAPKGRLKTPWFIYAIRGLGTAGTTALGIHLSKTDAHLGGLISVFPVIFTTTMVSVWIHQGRAVSQGAIGPLMLGQTSSGVLLVMMTFLPLYLNIYVALLLCFTVCVLAVNLPAYFYIQWRMKKKHARVVAREIEEEEKLS